MHKEKWTDPELQALYVAFASVTGMQWGDALAAPRAPGGGFGLPYRTWPMVGAKVPNKSAEQCRIRFNTEFGLAKAGEAPRPHNTMKPSRPRVGVVDASPWLSNKPFAGMSDRDIAAWAKTV